MDRSDLDIPESTVWPKSEEAPQAPVASKEALEAETAGVPPAGSEGETPIELGPGEGAEGGEDRSSGEQIPSLDPGRDDVDRNAAAGGWEGANEQIENDFEAEQLREKQEPREDG